MQRKCEHFFLSVFVNNARFGFYLATLQTVHKVNFFYFPLKNGNIAKSMPFIWKDYCRFYYENVLNGKHGKWNKTKKTSGIPFLFGKIARNS
jgi:hypothetical protein